MDPICHLDAAALAELRKCWAWRLPADFEVLLVTAFGDVFYQPQDGGVYWLNTGTGETELVASDRTAFEAKLHGDEGVDWLLPDLIEALEAEGKDRASGHCYTYGILPIFAEGEFETWNFQAVPVRQHFALTAKIHRQVTELPDGAQVNIRVEP